MADNPSPGFVREHLIDAARMPGAIDETSAESRRRFKRPEKPFAVAACPQEAA